MSRSRLVIALLALLVLTACTGESPRPPAAAPSLPADVFPGPPNLATGVETTVEAMAGDGDTMLMVLTVEGRISLPVLRYSRDAGITWRDGLPSTAAASETAVGEEAVGVAAVAKDGSARRWLSMTSKDEALFAWTSTDAQTWDRTRVVGIDPSKGEQVFSVAGLSGGGFVAVGGGWSHDKVWPTAWTSPDGITWTARRLGGEGWLREVATSGDRVVAVGARGLPRVSKGRSQLPLLFTSADRGAGWRRVTVDEPATSDRFVSSLSHAVATRDGFMVGGSYYDGAARSYRPLLLTTKDLRSWRAPHRLPDAGGSSGIAELLQLESATLAVQHSSTAGAPDTLRVSYLFPGDPSWTPAATPSSPGSAWSSAAAGAGGAAVIAIGIDGNPRTTRLWRFESPAQIAATDVSAPAEARVSVQPRGLLVVEDRLAAFGRAQGSYVLWRTEGPGFGTPVPIEVAANESIGGVTWSADGGYLAIGRVDDTDAFVMHSTDGRAWRRTAPKVFNRVARYHHAEITGATRAHGRWVVVGERSSNADVRRSALVASSADGLTWRPGRPARVSGRGDWYGRRDPLDDLHGLDGRARAMAAVTAVGSGLVAVGSIGDGHGTEPAAWVAADARTWRLVRLPFGSYTQAGVSSVHRVGSVLVGYGWALGERTTRTARAVWRSTDGGAHWSFTAFDGTHSGALMTSNEGEFIQAVLADDHRTITLWRSPDGGSWTQSPVVVDGLADGMEVSLDDTLVHAGAVQLLLTLRNRLDAVAVVQRVSL